MTEEVKLDSGEQVTEDADQDKNSGSIFTQEDVDRIVRDRVAREKINTAKAKEDFKAYKDSTDETLLKYEENVAKQVEVLSADLPDTIKNILGRLSVYEQLNWLTDPENKQETKKVTSPKTPTPVDQKPVIKHSKVREVI